MEMLSAGDFVNELFVIVAGQCEQLHLGPVATSERLHLDTKHGLHPSLMYVCTFLVWLGYSIVGIIIIIIVLYSLFRVLSDPSDLRHLLPQTRKGCTCC